MRPNRLKPPEGGVFHIVSRVVDRAMKFDNREKDVFTGMMRRAERFSGVEILAYCVMSNHFHILVRVPPKDTQISEAELLDRHAALYGEERRLRLERSWARRREKGRGEAVEREKSALLVRMHDVSEFAKTLKQRYSISYNRRHDRKGTLWEERFRSVLAEDVSSVLREVAAYIDLNPVRAEIVEAPTSYRWSSFGALSMGNPTARRGYNALLRADPSFGVADYVAMVSARAASRLPLREKKRGQALQKAHPYAVSRIRCFTYGEALGREMFVKKAGTGIAFPAKAEGMCTARPLAEER